MAIARHRRSVLELETVQRYMLGIEVGNGIERIAQAVRRLKRYAVHYIKVDIIKARTACIIIASHRVIPCMYARKLMQLRVRCGLNTYREAVHPCLAAFFQL